MFANGMYMATPDFYTNILNEVTYNVRRIRNHPCIALWAGNNEVFIMWYFWGIPQIEALTPD